MKELEYKEEIRRLKDQLKSLEYSSVSNLQKLLQLSEEKYQRLVREMKSAMVVYQVQNNGQDFILKDFNKHAEIIENVKKEDVLGRNVESVFPGIAKMGLLEAFHRVWETGEPENFPISIYQDDRIFGWRENYIYKLSTGEIVNIYQDITKKMQTQEALQKSERNYKFLVDNTKDTIWTTDLNFKTNYINNSVYNLLGYTVEEFLKLNITDYLPLKELEKLQEMSQKMTQSNLKNEYVSFTQEFEHIHKDGHILIVEVIGNSIINNQGEIIGYQGRTVDITKDKKKEQQIQRLSTAVEQSANSIVITDIDGNMEYVNPRYIQITGYSYQEVLGKNPKILNARTQSRLYYQEMWEHVSSGKVWKGEFHNKKKSGELFWENVTISPILNNKREIINYLAIKEDITEIKKTREDLLASEEKLRSIFENGPNMFYSHDVNNQLTYVSPQVKEILGYTPKELHINWQNLLTDHPDNSVGVQKTKNAINSGKPQGSYELELYHKSGAKVWVEVWESPQVVNGKTVAIMGYLSEITERKKNQQIQKLLYNISSAVHTTKNLKDLLELIRLELGKIIDTTNFYVALLDTKTDTLNFPLYYSEKDFFSTASASKTITKYVIQTNKPLIANTEIRERMISEGIIKYQGEMSKVWLGVPLSTQDGIKGAFAIQSYTNEDAFTASDLEILSYVSDQISMAIHKKELERKQIESEKRFKYLFNGLGDAVYVTKIDGPQVGKILEVNPAAIKQTGYSREELLNMNILSDLYVPNSNELDLEVWNNMLLNGDAVTTTDKKIDKKGREYWTEVIITPIEFKGIKACISINHDISNRINKEKELIEAKEKAEESDRLKSAFLANMSHEIRTPMNGILGFTGLLQEPDLTPEDMKTYSAVIERSGARMLETVNNLIDISRIEANQVHPLFSSVNINTQIDNLYQFFKAETDKKGLQLNSFKGLVDDKAFVITDNEKLYGALTNLIKNAIKYTPTGEIEFGYNYNENKLVFFVKDTGMGVPEEKQKSIFDRFIQADLSLSSQFEGAGLGLSITKAYVDMLGGKLKIKSEVGKGSQFYFDIPYQLANDSF